MLTKSVRKLTKFREFVVSAWNKECQERLTWDLEVPSFETYVSKHLSLLRFRFRYENSSIARSPERYTFQKYRVLDRKTKSPKSVRETIFNYYQSTEHSESMKFLEPEQKENNLEYDLRTTQWILEKVRESDTYAQNLYAALCNNDFQKLAMMPILKNEKWHCSWRYAGGIVADMLGKGDYIDWYCSGIRDPDYENIANYVGEGYVTEEIEGDLKALGWIVLEEENG